MKFSCQCSIPNPKAKAASAFVTYLPWELRYSTFRSLTRPLLCSMLINAPNLGAAHNFASTDAYSNIIVRHGGITVKKKRRPKGLPFRESVPKEPQKHTTAYGTLPCNCRKVFTHKDLATTDRGGGYLNYFSFRQRFHCSLAASCPFPPSSLINARPVHRPAFRASRRGRVLVAKACTSPPDARCSHAQIHLVTELLSTRCSRACQYPRCLPGLPRPGKAAGQ